MTNSPDTNESREYPGAKARFRGHGPSFNTKKGEVFYSPGRDFAYVYPEMLRSTLLAFNQGYWPKLFDAYARDMASKYGFDVERAFEELDKAKSAYYSFVDHCCDSENDSVADVLAKVGWPDSLYHESMVTWLAMLGQVVTGQIYAGVREITTQGEVSEASKMLVKLGHDARRAMNGLVLKDDAATSFRLAVRRCRAAGLSFSEMKELIADVELGRVPPPESVGPDAVPVETVP